MLRFTARLGLCPPHHCHTALLALHVYQGNKVGLGTIYLVDPTTD